MPAPGIKTSVRLAARKILEDQGYSGNVVKALDATIARMRKGRSFAELQQIDPETLAEKVRVFNKETLGSIGEGKKTSRTQALSAAVKKAAATPVEKVPAGEADLSPLLEKSIEKAKAAPKAPKTASKATQSPPVGAKSASEAIKTAVSAPKASARPAPESQKAAAMRQELLMEMPEGLAKLDLARPPVVKTPAPFPEQLPESFKLQLAQNWAPPSGGGLNLPPQEQIPIYRPDFAPSTEGPFNPSPSLLGRNLPPSLPVEQPVVAGSPWAEAGVPPSPPSWQEARGTGGALKLPVPEIPTARPGRIQPGDRPPAPVRGSLTPEGMGAAAEQRATLGRGSSGPALLGIPAGIALGGAAEAAFAGENPLSGGWNALRQAGQSVGGELTGDEDIQQQNQVNWLQNIGALDQEQADAMMAPPNPEIPAEPMAEANVGLGGLPPIQSRRPESPDLAEAIAGIVSSGVQQASGALEAPITYEGPSEPSVQQLMAALSQIESKGNYTATNPESSALGRYQMINSSREAWSKKHLGRVVGREEFLAKPELQDAIAKAQIQEYVDQAHAKGLSGPAVGRYVADSWHLGHQWNEAAEGNPYDHATYVQNFDRALSGLPTGGFSGGATRTTSVKDILGKVVGGGLLNVGKELKKGAEEKKTWKAPSRAAEAAPPYPSAPVEPKINYSYSPNFLKLVAESNDPELKQQYLKPIPKDEDPYGFGLTYRDPPPQAEPPPAPPPVPGNFVPSAIAQQAMRGQMTYPRPPPSRPQPFDEMRPGSPPGDTFQPQKPLTFDPFETTGSPSLQFPGIGPTPQRQVVPLPLRKPRI